MNPLLLQFANGRAFFLGMAMVAGCLVARPYLTRRAFRSPATIGAILGAAFVALSATPLPILIYLGWSAMVAIGLLAPIRPAPDVRVTPLRRPTVGVPALLSMVLCTFELSYQLAPRIPLSPGQTIYVLGDSISAGIGGKERCWPQVLADRSGRLVVNLAQPGARVAHGAKQARGITAAHPLVLVELGGNDLLGGEDSETFARELDELLGSLRVRGCRVAMFELPLPPLANSFGAAQRWLAAKHGVLLIPKRTLTAVFGTRGATLDGLHLSQEGHNQLAQRVLEMLEIE